MYLTINKEPIRSVPFCSKSFLKIMAEENTDTPPVIQETTASSSDKVAEVSAGGDQAAAESSENVTSKSDESTPAIIKRAPKRKSEQPEEEHADDDTEGKIASLEQPLVVEGKRERKKVERLAITPVQESPRDKHELSEGKGDKLGDIARIEFQLGKFHAEDLKPLHRLLFARAGSNNEVKKNIRKFNGFPFDKDSKDYEKKNDQLVKFTIAGLKTLCEVLDLERSGTKEALMDRILGFLLLPKDSGKPVPQSKKRKSSSSSKQKKKRKSSSAKKPKKDKAEGEESEASDDDEDNDKEDEEAEDDADDKSAAEDDGDAQKSASDKDEDSDFKPSKKEPKPKKAKVEKKKDSPKKKTPKKSKSSKVDKAEGDDADSSEEKDEDDEPLRPKKPQEPSNDDLKRDIKQLLEGANLEEITMKTVCKQIYDKYPLFDLTGRKEFIKATVKKLVQ